MRDAAELWAASGSVVPAGRGAEWAPRAAWQAPVSLEEAMSAKTAPAPEAVTVYGNHGRWVVECPDCSSAQLACRTDHRFMCGECANLAIGGRWRPVVWPKDAHEIADELARRPEVSTRNWVPGESVAQLAEERAAHLKPAPAVVDWSGHTHTWRNVGDAMVECRECLLVLPEEVLDETARRAR